MRNAVPADFTDPDRYLKVLADPHTLTIAKVQDLLLSVTADFWRSRGALNLHLPLTTGSVSSPMGLGSDSKPVAIDLHGERTYLADSMQFLLEYGCRIAPRGTWYVMPSFRAEDPDETHLNQFFHSEAEIPGDLDAVMEVVGDYLRTLAVGVLEQLLDDVHLMAGTVDHVRAMADLQPFPAITFDEAARLLAGDDEAVRVDPHGFRVLTRHGEQRLLQEVSPILWVTHYDHLSVPFYQAAEPGTVLARNADLLFGIGEVVGSGERHITGDQVRVALGVHEVAEENYAWYVRMKDELPMLTSGFGMGVERWMMWLLRQDDIRYLQLVPRFKGVALAP
jgi:asparaginyl-tRNA synthetase